MKLDIADREDTQSTPSAETKATTKPQADTRHKPTDAKERKRKTKDETHVGHNPSRRGGRAMPMVVNPHGRGVRSRRAPPISLETAMMNRGRRPAGHAKHAFRRDKGHNQATSRHTPQANRRQGTKTRKQRTKRMWATTQAAEGGERCLW